MKIQLPRMDSLPRPPRLYLVIGGVLALLVGSLWLWSSDPEPLPGGSEERSLKPVAGVAASGREQRLALVIGNERYADKPLRNPVNDARDMRKTLEALDFKVIYRENADIEAMNSAMAEFRQRLGPDTVGLFYFSGHGVQADSANYLIPVGASIASKAELKSRAYDASIVLGDMEEAKTRLSLIILDACRDNPFKSYRSAQGGLTQMGGGAAGTIIAFASAAGATAEDGRGRNGTFTQHLLKEIVQPGQTALAALQRVQTAVADATGGSQNPWLNNGPLHGQFCFAGCESVPARDATSQEAAFWNDIKGSQDPADFQEYLRQFPDGRHAGLARNAVQRLSASAPPAAAEPEPPASPGWLARLGQWAGGKTTGASTPGESGGPGTAIPGFVQFVAGTSTPGASGYAASAAVPPPPEAVASADTVPELVAIRGGCFQMGNPAGEVGREADETRHRVCVQDFRLGKYEVTRTQYTAFVEATGYSGGSSCFTYDVDTGKWVNRAGRDWRSPGYSQGGNHPVVCVSLEDAEAYARWLSGQTGRRYRLPTEAEWEYAARSGTETARYWGDDPDRACDYANVADQTAGKEYSSWTVHACADGAVHTTTVGRYRPNPFGLFDMLGNVWEWTCSAYTKGGYDGHEKTCTNDARSRRVDRGGSWLDFPDDVRSAIRDVSDPTDRSYNLGFRLAQD